MNEAEHLLTIAAEECAEVAHRLSKIPPVPVPGDRSHRWIIATCCRDCGLVARRRYAD